MMDPTPQFRYMNGQLEWRVSKGYSRNYDCLFIVDNRLLLKIQPNYKLLSFIISFQERFVARRHCRRSQFFYLIKSKCVVFDTIVSTHDFDCARRRTHGPIRPIENTSTSEWTYVCVRLCVLVDGIVWAICGVRSGCECARGRERCMHERRVEKGDRLFATAKKICVKIDESIFAIDFLSAAYRFIIGPNNTKQ